MDGPQLLCNAQVFYQTVIYVICINDLGVQNKFCVAISPRRPVPLGRYCLTRSPSRLAATDSFDSVSPVLAISCTDERMRSTSDLRSVTQASTASAPDAPLPALAAVTPLLS